MKAHLLHGARDFDPESELPPNESSLTQDLQLKTFFDAMARGDEFLFRVARQAVFAGLREDAETIFYRQAALKDCLENEIVVRNLYDIAVEAIETKKASWLGVFARTPGGILYDSVKLLQMLVEVLGKLKRLSSDHPGAFHSEAFTALFEMIKTELTDEYLATIKAYLAELTGCEDVLVSAELGPGNQGQNFVLRKPTRKRRAWFERLLSGAPRIYTYRIDDRDEAGARALSDLRDHGLNEVANALAQSSDHVLSFFLMLRTELAFYIGCMNLHQHLCARQVPVCFPNPQFPEAAKYSAVGLRDVCLVLASREPIVGNDLSADGKMLIIITGANQGGKSTFLRAIGLAQLMMQCGMFVAADAFSADIRHSLFAHYKREEDTTMTHGKFDEELKRMSDIADAIKPGALLLLNESFAATNEREGSEIARQIVRALLEAKVKVVFVTHLTEFARVFWQEGFDEVLFIRAERKADGSRTFKLRPGEPLETSFGADVYQKIFDVPQQSE